MTNNIFWKYESGDVVACTEKIKVLNENLAELRQMLQDAFEDGLLMGCSEQQLRDVFQTILTELKNPYSHTSEESGD